MATFAAGGANVTGSGDVVIFSYDGKTYALLSTAVGFKEATDALVDITGANVASLTETNFGGASSTPTPTPTPTPPGTIYSTYAEFVNAVTFGKIPAGEQVGISTLTGREAGMLAVNKTYLDKIAAGGIGNVTGDIEVTVGTTTGGVSNNFDSTAFASKLATGAVGSTVMNINGSNTAADVIVTTFGGTINGSGEADIITAYAAATINGDAGNDTIYATAGGSINGGAGTDTIYVSGTGATTIEGSGDNDTISLGAGADTVVFAGSLTNNGKDTITGFTAGAGGDKLNFKDFSDSLTVGNLTVGSTAKQALDTNNKIYQTTINDNIVLKDYGSANFDELFAANGTPFTTSTTNNNKELIVVKGNDVTQIYYVSATAGTLTDAMVDLVAEIDNNGSGVTLTADNFVF